MNNKSTTVVERFSITKAISIKESLEGKYPYNVDSTCIGNYHIQWWIIKKYGYTKPKKSFIKERSIQDSVFSYLWQLNKLTMFPVKKGKFDSSRYLGKQIKGIVFDEELVLVGTFFAGSTHMYRFLKSNGKIDVSDGLSSIVSYLRDYMKIRNTYIVSDLLTSK